MNELVTFAKKEKSFKIQNAIEFQQKVIFRTFCSDEKRLLKEKKARWCRNVIHVLY